MVSRMDYIRKFDIDLEKEYYYAGEKLKGHVVVENIENLKVRGRFQGQKSKYCFKVIGNPIGHSIIKWKLTFQVGKTYPANNHYLSRSFGENCDSLHAL